MVGRGWREEELVHVIFADLELAIFVDIQLVVARRGVVIELEGGCGGDDGGGDVVERGSCGMMVAEMWWGPYPVLSHFLQVVVGGRARYILSAV